VGVEPNIDGGIPDAFVVFRHVRCDDFVLDSEQQLAREIFLRGCGGMLRLEKKTMRSCHR